MRRPLLFLLCALLLFAWSARAGADDAETLLKEGVELRRVGKETEALERFKRAQALSPSPRALAQIGLASKSLRLYVDAETALLAALSAAEDPWIQQNRPALELARDVVEKQLASLVVRSSAADAELIVNGSAVGKLPLEKPVRVLAGTTHIELRAPGHQPKQVAANLPAAVTTELSLDLEPMTDPPIAPAPETPPLEALPPKPLPPATPWRRLAVYGAGGIGVIGLGIGTFFGVKTLDAKSERDALCNEASCANEDGIALDRDARSAATISTIAFGVGVAAIATAVVLLFTEPRPAKASRVLSTFGRF